MIVGRYGRSEQYDEATLARTLRKLVLRSRRVIVVAEQAAQAVAATNSQSGSAHGWSARSADPSVLSRAAAVERRAQPRFEVNKDCRRRSSSRSSAAPSFSASLMLPSRANASIP